MKSHDHTLILGLVEAIITDYLKVYPEDRQSCMRDMQRLLFLSQHRGRGLWTLDLPSLDDQLLAGLELGAFSFSGLHSCKWKKSYPVPKLFSGFWKRIADNSLVLRVDADPFVIFVLRSILCVGKKLRLECSIDRKRIAIKDYTAIENALPSPTHNWSGDNLFGYSQAIDVCLTDSIPSTDLFSQGEIDSVMKPILKSCQQVADMICSRMRPFDLDSFIEENMVERGVTGLRHGPGAVASGSKSYDKYDFRYWSMKLRSVFPTSLSGKTDLVNHELPSRVIMVPKTAKSPRIIAAEPVEHQWCQQLLLRYMDGEFKRLFGRRFVTLNDQGPNGLMALRASSSGKHCTIDLSSASDRLSLYVVERIFRCNSRLLSALHASRTRWSKLPEGMSRDSHVILKKFASQGTAVTFPVQSFVFLVITLGCVLHGKEITWNSILKQAKDIRVFGDDIIAPNDRYTLIKSCLASLFLKVNENKSFSRGLFRESCGVDAYDGVDVTPVRIQRLKGPDPESVQSGIDIANLYFKRGLWHASEYMMVQWVGLANCKNLPIAASDLGSSALYSFSGSSVDHLKKRWSALLQRFEYLTLVFTSKENKRRRDDTNAFFEFLTQGSSPEFIRDGYSIGVPKTRKGLRWRAYLI